MQLLFGTPVGAYNIPNAPQINAVLAACVRTHEPLSANATKSNIGGWHSGMDLLEWPEIRQTDFEATIRSATLKMVRQTAGLPDLQAELVLSAWANLNRSGAFHLPHNHPGNDWSGVYYVHVGDMGNQRERNAGHLVLHDPRGSINMIRHPGANPFGSIVHIPPVAGQLVLFPAWLQHSVMPFDTCEERITIAFNARISACQEPVAA